MDQEIEHRWCKFCMTKTKQELVFLPNMATYKRRRKYKCAIVAKQVGYKIAAHLQKVFIEKIIDQIDSFCKKLLEKL